MIDFGKIDSKINEINKIILVYIQNDCKNDIPDNIEQIKKLWMSVIFNINLLRDVIQNPEDDDDINSEFEKVSNAINNLTRTCKELIDKSPDLSEKIKELSNHVHSNDSSSGHVNGSIDAGSSNGRISPRNK